MDLSEINTYYVLLLHLLSVTDASFKLPDLPTHSRHYTHPFLHLHLCRIAVFIRPFGSVWAQTALFVALNLFSLDDKTVFHNK